eukprot:gnl/TRDRNA2_/TRDRNA2_205640_c0_seq1.p2 gnl/TRDRNA2_/TRDRNA2_205640_c0~~gnl/TRDRNA2_/TRDRNA2_205640_c0_seq1.p2  ORF type:complete len:154 (+),score=22.68 gnl/TRDRNA2_/TRDRNA2_205640_c0_seq1:174-635(+)
MQVRTCEMHPAHDEKHGILLTEKQEEQDREQEEQLEDQELEDREIREQKYEDKDREEETQKRNDEDKVASLLVCLGSLASGSCKLLLLSDVRLPYGSKPRARELEQVAAQWRSTDSRQKAPASSAPSTTVQATGVAWRRPPLPGAEVSFWRND